MGLKIKTFTEILKDMALWIRTNSSTLTNFTIGSVIRTLLESVAMEVEALYFQMKKGFNWAVENAIYNSFDFTQVGALKSSGEVTLVFREELRDSVIINAGYRFAAVSTNGQSIFFKTIQDEKIPPYSSSYKVKVECETEGLVGNVSAYTISVMLTPIEYVQECYNEIAFTNGREAQTAPERKKDFSKFIKTLSKGTVGAVEYGAMSVEGITGVYVDDQIGYMNVYAHDASGELSDELKAKVLEKLIDFRSGGIEVIVLPVVKKSIDLDISVHIGKGFDEDYYQTLITSSVTSFLNSYAVSHSLINAELIRYIMSIDEDAIINASVNLDSDIEVGNNELIHAGQINVEITQ